MESANRPFSLHLPCLLTSIPLPLLRGYYRYIYNIIESYSWPFSAPLRSLGGKNRVAMLGQRPVQAMLRDVCVAEYEGPLEAVVSRILP